MMKKETSSFIVKVTIYHIVTYIICGMFFSAVFNYESAWQTGVFAETMRSWDSIIIRLGPVFQIIRGLIYAGILYLIPKEFFMTRYSWLKLWAITAGIGILNTPGPGGGSIEGLIYSKMPMKNWIYCIEIYVQTLWFSILVCRINRPKKTSLWKKYRIAVLNAAAVIVTVMVSGIALAVLFKLDLSDAQNDIGATITLFAGAVLTFCFTRFYEIFPSKSRLGILLVISFLSGGVLPTLYNYIMHTPYRTPSTLIAGLVSAGLVMWIVKLFREVPVSEQVQ